MPKMICVSITFSLKLLADKVYKALVQKLLFTNPFHPHEERSEGYLWLMTLKFS
jgi:hypothetical protein